MEIPRRHGDHDSGANYVWESLNPEIRSRVSATKSSLSAANKDEQMMSLNLYLMMRSTGLDQEHLKMMIRGGGATFYVHEPRWDNLNHIEPILDPRIINKTVIEGSFFQCRTLENDNGEFDIGYELRINDPNGTEYVAIVPDDSVRHIEKRIVVSEEEAVMEQEVRDIEKRLGKCFRLLGRPKNKEFREIVQNLSDLFYGDVTDGGDFCREIGLCATELMNHPIIISHPDYVPALEYILHHSLDDDVSWHVEGLADDMVISGNRVYADNLRDVELTRATYKGITLLSPEIEIKGKAVAETGRVTPAFIFEHKVGDATERITVPLIHIKVVYSENTGDWRVRYDDYVKNYPKAGGHLAELAMKRESERVRHYGP